MKSTLALIASILALSISCFVWYTQSTLTEKPLSAYDLKSPVEAIRTQARLIADMNLRAHVELEFLHKGRRQEAEDFLRTLEVRKEAEWKGTKLLFCAYEVKGIKKYDVRGVEKETDSGMWMPSSFGTYSLPDTEKELKEAIIAFEKDGTIK
jgi:hypothetical protein